LKEAFFDESTNSLCLSILLILLSNGNRWKWRYT
jgi:hypothetical protein